MADAIVEQIADAIKTQIETIDTDNTPPVGGGGAYDDSILDCVRPTARGGADPKHKRVVLIQGARSANIPADVEGGSSGSSSGRSWNQEFLIAFYFLQSERDKRAIDTLVNNFGATIERGVMDDVQWGGLALDSEILAVEPFEEAEVTGQLIVLNVQYRTAENNPFTQR